MSPTPLVGLCSAVVGAGGLSLLLRSVAVPGSTLRGLLEARRDKLDRELKFLRSPWSASALLGVQLGLSAAFFVSLWFEPWLSLFCFLLAVAPEFFVYRARNQRVLSIEAQIEGWMAMLARALEAAPSLGEAVEMSSTLCSAPLSEELEQAVSEMHLGRSLGRALSAMEERVQSRTLSLALSTVRVGQQTGGDLPDVLRTAAQALREMARLEGVIRTKTAEGRAQAWVISALPFPLYFAVRMGDPDYFAPLQETFMGHVLLGIAAFLWVAAVFSARKILAVSI